MRWLIIRNYGVVNDLPSSYNKDDHEKKEIQKSSFQHSETVK